MSTLILIDIQDEWKDENIQILQNIRPETAIKIEQSNYENDIWQTLFFDKNN